MHLKLSRQIISSQGLGPKGTSLLSTLAPKARPSVPANPKRKYLGFPQAFPKRLSKILEGNPIRPFVLKNALGIFLKNHFIPGLSPKCTRILYTLAS